MTLTLGASRPHRRGLSTRNCARPLEVQNECPRTKTTFATSEHQEAGRSSTLNHLHSSGATIWGYAWQSDTSGDVAVERIEASVCPPAHR